MPIRFICACGKVHQIPDRMAGKRGTCGRCSLSFVAPGVPLPEDQVPPPEAARRGLGLPVACLVTGLVIGAAGAWSARPLLSPGRDPDGVGAATPPAIPAPVALVRAPTPPPARAEPDPTAAPRTVPRPIPKPVARAARGPREAAPRAALDEKQRAVVAHLRKYAHDPSDFEIVEIWKPVPGDCGMSFYTYNTAVYYVARARNAFGARVVETGLCLLDGQSVVHVAHPEDMDRQAWSYEMRRHYGTPAMRDPLADWVKGMMAPGKGPLPPFKPR